jgi:ABC-type bacteriocin/lantibiotic exporter with double-glycine peptidase domain
MDQLDDVADNAIDPELARPALPPGPDQPVRLQGFLELKNVTFGYNPAAKPLISGFSLSLKPGDRVALVGATGAGKSTVGSIISGLVAPWEGEVLFDGKPRSQIDHKVMTRSLGRVSQDIFLFAGSVRDNVTLWDTSVDETDVIQATRDACVHDIVASRPGGYESPVAEGGTNFSGGERQRLEIARALALDPAIVVLDEATAALDPATELTIDNNLRRRGYTCIIIAHRLSTIRDCNEIIVLDRGQVVQRGTHDELVQQSDGLYLHLVQTA